MWAKQRSTNSGASAAFLPGCAQSPQRSVECGRTARRLLIRLGSKSRVYRIDGQALLALLRLRLYLLDAPRSLQSARSSQKALNDLLDDFGQFRGSSTRARSIHHRMTTPAQPFFVRRSAGVKRTRV